MIAGASLGVLQHAGFFSVAHLIHVRRPHQYKLVAAVGRKLMPSVVVHLSLAVDPGIRAA